MQQSVKIPDRGFMLESPDENRSWSRLHIYCSSGLPLRNAMAIQKDYWQVLTPIIPRSGISYILALYKQPRKSKSGRYECMLWNLGERIRQQRSAPLQCGAPRPGTLLNLAG